ncbi:ParB/RepB/Spo0J family partition protein [Acinetobacter johnsonii]|uniref:ParB/RepB/Spo0J family partition protein n=1 Tax=Acinetobacter johnsonii TaxID=40214 RepID=UPI002446F9ED|nr:ParB/RepB/Spo0J family partition protein [Acinetobacter johnsonii]MDG9798741.1 ParB/RepB/Spo0J family partition protein [Acinetobacter johnsonii]
MSGNKGLEALKGAVGKLNNNNLAGKKLVILQIGDVQADPENPRQNFDQEKIIELAMSIASVGQLEPISVRDNGESKGKYFTNFGARRVLAIQWLKENMPENPNSSTVEAIINNDFSSLGKLVENIQRENLSATEIGIRLKQEIDEKGLTPKELSEQLGKTKTWISRHLSVTEVSDYVKDLIAQDVVSNVEVILNIEKLYKSNAEDLEERVESFKSENEGGGTITLALSRKWLKSANGADSEDVQHSVVDNTTTVETVVESKDVSMDKVDQGSNAVKTTVTNDESFALTQSEDQGTDNEDDSNSDIDNLKSLQQGAESLIKGKKEQGKQDGFLSVELKKEYAHGALTGYQNLYDLAIENEDEAEARLSRQVLKSFSGQDMKLNWEAVGNYPNLLEEIGQIVASYQFAGYISPKELKNKDVDALISQRELF